MSNDAGLSCTLRFADSTTMEIVREVVMQSEYERVRKIQIEVESDGIAVKYLQSAVDIFLEPRCWWIFHREGHTTPSSAEKKLYFNVLLRVDPSWESPLRRLSAIQFPRDVSACAEAALSVGHMVNSGWGSHLSYYSTEILNHPWNIFTIWDSNSNLATESVAYASASLCPLTVNKRECAFLPTSNCSLPAEFANTKGEFSTDRSDKIWGNQLMVFYSSASESAKALTREAAEQSGHSPRGSYQLALSQTDISHASYALRSTQFMDTDGFVCERTAQASALPSASAIAMMFAYILRPNARYRSLIHQRVLQFHEAFPHVDMNHCVAVHVRRGDRVRSAVNMTNYCDGMTRKEVNGEWICTNRHKSLVDCQAVADYGCFTAHPFGSLTLADYLRRVRMLMDTRDVFVLTDDEDWIREQIGRVENEAWKVGYVAAKKDGRGTSEAVATSNGVDFLASLRLASMCRGFVGHWGSGVSQLVYFYMCFQHGNTMAECPRAVDIGNRKSS